MSSQEVDSNEFDEWFDAITIKSKDEEAKYESTTMCDTENIPCGTMDTPPGNSLQNEMFVERRLRNRTISQRKLLN